MHEPLLSIVVPYFNQPENLRDLLQCLAKQTLKDMEIIIVNDFSEKTPDKIIADMKTQGLNIAYIRQPQRQYTLQARFAGMKKAQGKYLAFMDSDDLAFYDNSYEKAANLAQEKQSDILHFFTMQNNKLGFAVPRPETLPFANSLNGKDIFKTWLEKGCISHSVWNKLYSKKLYKKITELKHPIHIFRIEDFYLTCFFLFFAEKYDSCDIPVYYYKPPQAKGSLEKLAGRSADAWQLYLHLPNILESYGLDQDNKQKLKLYIETLALLNHGTAHIHLKNSHDKNLKYSNNILDTYKKYATIEDIIAGLILANSHNAGKVLKLYKNFH